MFALVFPTGLCFTYSMFFCLIPSLVLKSCLVLGIFLFFLVFL